MERDLFDDVASDSLLFLFDGEETDELAGFGGDDLGGVEDVFDFVEGVGLGVLDAAVDAEADVAAEADCVDGLRGAAVARASDAFVHGCE